MWRNDPGCSHRSLGCYVHNKEFFCAGRQFGSQGIERSALFFINDIPKAEALHVIYLHVNFILRNFRAEMLTGFTALKQLHIGGNLHTNDAIDCRIVQQLPATLEVYENPYDYEPPSVPNQHRPRMEENIVNNLGVEICEIVVSTKSKIDVTGSIDTAATAVDLNIYTMQSLAKLHASTTKVRITRDDGDGVLARLTEIVVTDQEGNRVEAACVSKDDGYDDVSKRTMREDLVLLMTDDTNYMRLSAEEERTDFCWIRLPTGCDQGLYESSTPTDWFKRLTTESRAKDKTFCQVEEKIQFNSWCNRTDAEAEWTSKPFLTSLDTDRKVTAEYYHDGRAVLDHNPATYWSPNFGKFGRDPEDGWSLGFNFWKPTTLQKITVASRFDHKQEVLVEGYAWHVVRAAKVYHSATGNDDDWTEVGVVNDANNQLVEVNVGCMNLGGCDSGSLMKGAIVDWDGDAALEYLLPVASEADSSSELVCPEVKVSSSNWLSESNPAACTWSSGDGNGHLERHVGAVSNYEECKQKVREAKVCFKIVTGSNEGYLTVFVDEGQGFGFTTKKVSARYAVDSIVFDECFGAGANLAVQNTESNGWVGTITMNGESVFCSNCDNDFNPTTPITTIFVDGNSDTSERTPIWCHNGKKCYITYNSDGMLEENTYCSADFVDGAECASAGGSCFPTDARVDCRHSCDLDPSCEGYSWDSSRLWCLKCVVANKNDPSSVTGQHAQWVTHWKLAKFKEPFNGARIEASVSSGTPRSCYAVASAFNVLKSPEGMTAGWSDVTSIVDSVQGVVQGPWGGDVASVTRSIDVVSGSQVRFQLVFWSVDSWDTGEKGYLKVDGVEVWSKTRSKWPDCTGWTYADDTVAPEIHTVHNDGDAPARCYSEVDVTVTVLSGSVVVEIGKILIVFLFAVFN